MNLIDSWALCWHACILQSVAFGGRRLHKQLHGSSYRAQRYISYSLAANQALCLDQPSILCSKAVACIEASSGCVWLFFAHRFAHIPLLAAVRERMSMCMCR
jgi:hypothetical protein